MTLGDFFAACSENPAILVFLMTAIPLTALLALVLGQGQGHLSPWKYLYSFLVYLTSVPGIFAVTLTIYLLVVERQSIMDTNIYTQIVPVVSMVVTLWLIRRNVPLRLVPGFGKLSGLLLVITAVITVLWILYRTRILAITFIPLVWVLVIFVVIVLVAITGVRRMKA